MTIRRNSLKYILLDDHTVNLHLGNNRRFLQRQRTFRLYLQKMSNHYNYYSKRAVYIGHDGFGRTGTAIKDASTGANNTSFLPDGDYAAVLVSDDHIWFDEDGYNNWNPYRK